MMKNILLLIAGFFFGIGCGVELTYWVGRSYGWVKEDVTIMLLALILGLNFIILGGIMSWWIWRRGRHVTINPGK